tara:strand:+ start:478 stop:1815 length:1338 start_codon:yes stop_codon:yes gene_type:complete
MEYLILGNEEYKDWKLVPFGSGSKYWRLVEPNQIRIKQDSEFNVYNHPIFKPVEEIGSDMFITTTGYILIPSTNSDSIIGDLKSFPPPPIKFPPDLSIENISFSLGPDIASDLGDATILEGTSGLIEFDIVNNGRGAAHLIQIGMVYLDRAEELIIVELKSKRRQRIQMPILVPIGSSRPNCEINISGLEYNGFDPDPQLFNLKIIEAPKPNLALNNITIDDDKKGDSWGNSDGIINKGESIEVILEIINNGSGNAENVSLAVSIPEIDGIFIPAQKGLDSSVNELKPSQIMESKFYFITNKRISASEIVLILSISESSNMLNQTFKPNLPIESIYEFIPIDGQIHSGQSYYWWYDWSTTDFNNCCHGVHISEFIILPNNRWESSESGSKGLYIINNNQFRFEFDTGPAYYIGEIYSDNGNIEIKGRCFNPNLNKEGSFRLKLIK